MADSILPTDRLDDVRSAIDPMLDDEALPSSVILSPVYLGRAERWVIANDPLYASRTGDEQESLYQAIIYMTASLLSVAVPQSRQINMAGHTATFTFAETPSERTARLASMAAAALASYLDLQPVTTNATVIVTTVEGRRA